MKKLFCPLLVSALASVLLADPGLIELATGVIDPAAPRMQTFAPAQAAPSAAGTRLYLAQPERNFDEADKAVLAELGARIHGYVPPNACILEATPEQAAELGGRLAFLYLELLEPEHKLLYVLEAGQPACGAGETRTLELAVYPVRTAYLPEVRQAMEKLGLKVTYCDWFGDPCLLAKMDDSQAALLAARGDVASLEPYHPLEVCNDVARSEALCNVDWLQMEGYTGKGQKVCIQDTGLDNGDLENIHPDFKNKSVEGYNTTSVALQRGTRDDWHDAGDHGTHVAGSATGTGAASDGQYRGMAPDASLFALCAGSSSGGILSGTEDDMQYTYDHGCRVMNNSWGYESSGAYTSSSVFWDRFLWEHPDYTVCFSAGNSNHKRTLPPETTMAPYSVAKNTIGVGAAENLRPEEGSGCFPEDGVHQGMASFSTRGPTRDGRNKPDLVTPGTGVMSVQASQDKTSVRSKYYSMKGGTSMASPIAAGCCTVVRDYLMHNRGVAAPASALVKAVLFAGCRTLFPGQYPQFQEIPSERPNSVEGHGHINLRESLEPKDGRMEFAEVSLSASGRAVTNTFEKTAGTDLTVSLVWTDYPGTSYAAKALVNDLDLYVVEPSGTVHNRNDHLNNNETLWLGDLPAGSYKVIVRAHTIMVGPQRAFVAFNCGNGNRIPKLDLATPAVFPWNSSVCEICLTNLVPGSYVSYNAYLTCDSEGVFSLDKTAGSFKAGDKLLLTADGSRTRDPYPTCVLKVIAGQAGVIEKRIGFPNGSPEKGYTLFKGDFDDYPYGSLEERAGAVRAAAGTETGLDFVEAETYDTLAALDFEDYVPDESVIGKKGWSVGYGNRTNGTTIVRREIKGGRTNQYLEVTRLASNYAPHFKISGAKTGWEKDRARRLYRISCRIKLTGDGKKSFSLWDPNFAELSFSDVGGSYLLETGYGNEDHPEYSPRGLLTAGEWSDFELVVDANPVNIGGQRHTIRSIKFAGVEQVCDAYAGQTQAKDYFGVMRFFQWGEGTFCLDDFKIERLVSDRECNKLAYCRNSGAGGGLPEDDRGLFFRLGVPRGLDKDYDLIVNARLALTPDCSEAVLGQDRAHRQFQSRLRNQGGKVSIFLEDYPGNTGLVTNTFPQEALFNYGFRLNMGEAEKILQSVFAGGDKIRVGEVLDSEKLAHDSALDDLRIYLPAVNGGLRLASLEARLAPVEKAKLCVVPGHFRPGDTSVQWLLTNSVPLKPVKYTARIADNGESFSVSPKSGIFDGSTSLTVTALTPGDERGLESGTIEIDGGEAGRVALRFHRPTGNERDGYVLYADEFSAAPEGDITAYDSAWRGTEFISGSVVRDGEGGYLHLGKEDVSDLPFDTQGMFCFIGAPGDRSTNLDWHVSAELRFPAKFGGYLYLTQDEPHRQFQSAFALSSSQVKLTLTDYTRNTGLFTQKAPINEWIGYEYFIGDLNGGKLLEEITFNGVTKEEDHLIAGSKVQKTREIDEMRLQLTGTGQSADLRRFRVTLDPPVPEPAGLLLFALVSLAISLRKH